MWLFLCNECPPPGATAMAAVLSERSGRPSEINDEISLFCASSWKRLFTNAGTAKTRWDERGATVKWGAFLWGRRGLGEVTFLLPSIWKGTCLSKLRRFANKPKKPMVFFGNLERYSRIPASERNARLRCLRCAFTQRTAARTPTPRPARRCPPRCVNGAARCGGAEGPLRDGCARGTAGRAKPPPWWRGAGCGVRPRVGVPALNLCPRCGKVSGRLGQKLITKVSVHRQCKTCL